MFITDINLYNFRNFLNKKFTFKNKKTLIFGKNGSGKTSILEAIYVLSFGKSFRSKKDINLITLGKNQSSLIGNFNTIKGKENIKIIFTEKGKKVYFNSKLVKLSEFFGNINTVIFSQKDIELIEGSPEVRRRFIDLLFSQIDEKYFTALIKYFKILKQKNYYLKSETIDKNLLDTLNTSLINMGSEIIFLRRKYLDEFFYHTQNIINSYDFKFLKNCAFEYYTNIIPADINIFDNLEKIKEQYKKTLYDIQEKEMVYKYSIVGPHRDDVVFSIKGKKYSDYSSTGEKKLLSIILKISESNFLSIKKIDEL